MRSPGSATGSRRRQLDLHQLDEATVERFLQRDPNIVHSAESAPLRRFLAMLREIGLAAAKPPEPKNDQQRFIDEYRCYLLQERGLAEASLLNYVPFAEELLSEPFRPVRHEPSQNLLPPTSQSSYEAAPTS